MIALGSQCKGSISLRDSEGPFGWDRKITKLRLSASYDRGDTELIMMYQGKYEGRSKCVPRDVRPGQYSSNNLVKQVLYQ